MAIYPLTFLLSSTKIHLADTTTYIEYLSYMAITEGSAALLPASEVRAFDMQQYAQRIMLALDRNNHFEFTKVDKQPQPNLEFAKSLKFQAIHTDGPGQIVIAATTEEWEKLSTLSVDSETSDEYIESSYTRVTLKSNHDTHVRHVIVKSYGVMHDILFPNTAKSLKTDTIQSMQKTQEDIGLFTHNPFQPKNLTIIFLGFRIWDNTKDSTYGSIDIVEPEEHPVTI